MGRIDDHIDKEITFVYFIRIDTQMRLDNIKFVSSFYQKHMPRAAHVFVEERGFKDNETPCKDIVNIRHIDGDEYIPINVDEGEEWNKCAGYNKGLAAVQSHITVFNDVDAVIDPDQIREAAITIEEGDADIVYPYNGEWLCVDDLEHKAQFGKTLDYDVLNRTYPDILANDQYPKQQLINHRTSDNVLIGHYNSRGGCVMGRTQTVKEAGGYNPNFKGWGYEDDEFPVRMHRLGLNVTRLAGSRMPCWHLTHTCIGQSEKETQPHHEANRLLCACIENMTKEEAQEYIKSWKVS
tara:strand:- start:13708 stop:14592 length:885 start_codon:yes stop_codon:yes gene_type:complete